MNAANARIDQRLNRRIRVRGRSGVVRVVDHARDAGVDASERGNEIADVDVVRAVVARKPLVGRGHVGPNCPIRNDAPQLPFPGMTMGVHESRDDDGVGGVNHLCLSWWPDFRRHAHDLLSFDQDIAFDEVADRGIEADDRAALQQEALVRHTGFTPAAL
jgi:hypothetical protein